MEQLNLESAQLIISTGYQFIILNLTLLGVPMASAAVVTLSPAEVDSPDWAVRALPNRRCTAPAVLLKPISLIFFEHWSHI